MPVTLSASSCILLKNMFDQSETSDPNFEGDMTMDVREEASKFGQVVHIFVDKNSEVRAPLTSLEPVLFSLSYLSLDIDPLNPL